jgi:hypothetical protein
MLDALSDPTKAANHGDVTPAEAILTAQAAPSS